MGGKDTPPLQYTSSSSMVQTPKWEPRRRAATLDRREVANQGIVPLRSHSASSLDAQQQEELPSAAGGDRWRRCSPRAEEEGSGSVRSSRSSSSPSCRSDGTVSPIRQYMECIEPQSLSCAVVGDSGVGKSSLLLSYTTGSMPLSHPPTVYDKFSSSILVYGKRISVTLCDTSGQDEFAHFRPLCYPQLDAVLVCFSVVDSESYENVKTKWCKEVRRHCPGVPIILVGTQVDKREDSAFTKELKSRGLRTVSRSDGVKLASLMKAVTYVECSALRQLNVKGAFDEAIAAALELGSRSKKRQSSCTIL